MASELKEWLVMLSDKQAPVFSHTKQQVLDILDDENLSSAETCRLIISDPGMAANLCKAINTRRNKEGRMPLTTIHGVVTLMGVGHLRKTIEQMETYESFNLEPSHLYGIERCYEQCWYTRQFALHWATDRGVREPEEVELAASLQCLPELLLWVYSGKTMPRINHQAYCDGKDYHEVVQQEMGCLKREIGVGLAESWSLPELAGFGFESHYSNFTHATAIALAALLARIVQHGVYGVDMDDFYNRATTYFGRDVENIAHDMHQYFVHLAPLEIEAGYRPIAGLLTSTTREKIYEQQYCIEPEVVAEHPVTDKAGNQPTAKHNIKRHHPEPEAHQEKQQTPRPVNSISPFNKKQYLAELEQFKLLIKQHKSVDQLINQALKILSDSVGLHRVCFLMLNKQKDTLQSRIRKVRVDDEDSKSQNLVISLKTKNLFKLLMQKPQSFILNKSNYEKYWAAVPGNVKTAIHVESFMAGSVFLATKAIGLVYADNLHDEINENKHKAFQQVIALLNKGLAISVAKK